MGRGISRRGFIGTILGAGAALATGVWRTAAAKTPVLGLAGEFGKIESVRFIHHPALEPFMQQKPLPACNSKTITWRRAVPKPIDHTALLEGVEPDPYEVKFEPVRRRRYRE